MPRGLAILVVVLSALLALSVAPAAPATIKGPCTGRIAGQDVAPLLTGPLDDAIVVHKDSLVSVTMSSERPLTRLKVEIEFAGQRWTVHERPTIGTSWVSEVPVDDYAIYGIGLYKIVASSEGQGFTCTGAALVSVEGDQELDALKTVAGIAGFTLALFGFLGVLAVAARVGKSRSAPFLGIIAGAVLGVGVTVLLQQFSVAYPTVGVAGGLDRDRRRARPCLQPLRPPPPLERRAERQSRVTADSCARGPNRPSSAQPLAPEHRLRARAWSALHPAHGP